MSWKKKVGLGAVAALSLVGTAAGAAGYAAQHLPLCETEVSSFAVENGRVCVSPDLSNNVDGVYRTARGLLHRGDAIEDLASGSSHVLTPEQARNSSSDGVLTVETWNLHHGTSQAADGSRGQLDEQIDQINETGADVVLLQEVTPWDAQELVDGTGNIGYYSQTTPRQGNLILVDPSLQVTENTRLTLNQDTPDKEHAASVVDGSKGEEPRQAQLIKLNGADTNGRSVAIFNTHLSTGTATPEQRADESERLRNFVQDHVSPDEAMVGGGDFNTRDGNGIVNGFREDGFEVQGARIDWLVSGNVTSQGMEQGDLYDESGTRLSDHPRVVARYQVDAASQ